MYVLGESIRLLNIVIYVTSYEDFYVQTYAMLRQCGALPRKAVFDEVPQPLFRAKVSKGGIQVDTPNGPMIVDVEYL